MASANFINLCTHNVAKIDVYFYLNNELITGVKSVSQIRRDSDLSAGELVVVVENTDGDLDDLVADYATTPHYGYVQLGFENEIEVLNIYTGVLEYVRFLDHEATVELTFKDKLSRLLNITIGDGENPVRIGHDAIGNAADVAWTILTDYGLLDDTESTANTDIDYAWFQTWEGIMLVGGGALDPYRLETYFTSQSCGSALKKLCDLTESVMWTNSDGKIRFSHPLMATTGQSYTVSKLFGRILELTTDERMGSFTCYYGYDPDTDEWAGNVPIYSSTYGLLDYNPIFIEQDRTMWHQTQASATRFVNECDDRIGYPSKRFELNTGLTGFLEDIGNQAAVVDAIYPAGQANAIIEELTLNLDEGLAMIRARWLY